MAAGDRSISEFPAASGLLTGDLLIVSEPDQNSNSGYQTFHLSASDIAEGILSVFQYPLLLETTAQTITGAINEVRGTFVSGTLAAGATSITLSDESITTSSTIDVYVDTWGINPDTVTVSTGSVTLTFEAQQAALGVKIRIS